MLKLIVGILIWIILIGVIGFMIFYAGVKASIELNENFYTDAYWFVDDRGKTLSKTIGKTLSKKK